MCQRQPLTDTFRLQVDVNRAAVCLNMAAVHLKQHRCLEAIALCTEALAAAPPSVKAHLRRAKAHMLLHQYQVRLCFVAQAVTLGTLLGDGCCTALPFNSCLALLHG